jgi:hypothetical protein
MDPMNSIWYYLEFQRQSSARNQVPFFAKPELRPGKAVKKWLIEALVPLSVLAAVVAFSLLCYLHPTLVA